MSTTDIAIRVRRAAFNRALADANLADIGQFLAPNVVLVTGTDSAVLSGRKAQLLAWKREFAADDRTVYARLPERIEVSPVEHIALEHGQWSAVTLSGRQTASGTYAAKWRSVRDEWVIEAEIYLTMA